MTGSTTYAHTHLRMGESGRALQGSSLNDVFKNLHKRYLAPHMVGCDLDFVIVEKNPDCIVAFKDIKRLGEPVTFTEVITYNVLMKVAPVYLLYADGEEGVNAGQFTIHRYFGGDRRPNPPTIRTRLWRQTANWEEFARWEQDMRDNSKLPINGPDIPL